MQRSLVLCLSLALGGTLGGPLGCRQHEKPKVTVQAGALALAPITGSTRADADITALQMLLNQSPPGNAATWNKLARAFVHKARESGDPGFYIQADDAAGRALAIDPESAGAVEVRLLVRTNAHRFAEARDLATAELKKHPRSEVAWGALGDSLLELGQYEGAEAAYQTMLDTKPDLRSYNRGSWMRWLIGDPEGAIELMELALGASSPRDLEARNFCRVQLGDYHFFGGRYDVAKTHYTMALSELPKYAPALAARGRAQLATGKIPEAIADLSMAIELQPLTSVRAIYIDALLAAGRDSDATAQMVILEREGRREDPRALALFYASHQREPKLALELAKEEAARRPDIWSQDALAWALYRNGKLDEAWVATQLATRLGTRDPRLLFHRGRIAAARNETKEALSALGGALLLSPTWDPHDAKEAREFVNSLNPGGAALPVAPAVKPAPAALPAAPAVKQAPVVKPAAPPPRSPLTVT